jgi:glycogen(starch) synthase
VTGGSTRGRRLHVLMTADTVGGVWTYSIELARALAPFGIEVSLATMGRPLNAVQWAEARSVPGLRVFESSFKLEWMEHPWADVAAAGTWLLRLEGELCPDIVQINGYAHAALDWRTPTLAVGHSCVLSWWEAVYGRPAPAEWDRYRAEVRNGLQAASLVLAPTAAMLSFLERNYGPTRRGMVVPNGRDPSRFPAAPKEPVIMAAGRLWDEAKNLAALDAAAGGLPWPVYVAGEEQHPEGGLVQSHNVQPLGQLPGQVLAQWLGRAAIYALPARYEPFGLSVLEAGLAGCALVLGDIPSLHEIWGDTALYVPPDRPDVLRDILNQLIDDAGLREDLAGRARTRALQLTPERMAAAYAAVYTTLLRGREHHVPSAISGALSYG